MALSVRELFRPLFYDLQDAESREYFVRVRYQGKADELAARARASLGVVEHYLAHSGGPFLLGEAASHADSIVYGWYCCSQVNARVVNPKLWHHESLPRVGKWVEAMKGRTGLEVAFPELEGYAY
jgi:glutathione S-transferase